MLFGKWFKKKKKKIRRKPFQNLTKDFLVNGSDFQYDHHLTIKQRPTNLKMFSEKYFTAKQM